MANNEAKVVCNSHELKVVLPMTLPTGKVRIKERSFFAQYGVPVAPRQIPLGQKNYVEWQIGYDLLATNENRGKTSLSSLEFRNYKNELKLAYELSEILFYSVQNKLISIAQVKNLYSLIKAVPEDLTFEKMDSMNISRTNPQEVSVNGLPFYKMMVSYPMLVHKFGQYDIYAEIVIKEKQRAVGTQAMLYVCLPLSSLRFKKSVFGRTLDAHETADWVIGREEAELALELFRIFGMLSPKHRFDVMAILEMLFPAL